MLEKNQPDLEGAISCDLCNHVYSPVQMAMRGKLSFCQTCANERSAECLSRLKNGGKNGRLRGIAQAILCLCLVGGAVWGAMAVFGSRIPHIQKLFAEKHVDPPAQKGDGDATVQAKTTETPWLDRIFTDRAHRSVADAGQIHLLFVTRPGTDGRMGLTSRLFVTREAPDDVGAKLTTEVGKQMEISFDEGLRYVRKQPRNWERKFSIRLSFEDKFIPKDGGSAGTGFTVGMLAAIEDVALDPDVAITGDLTIDGSVQPVGGVVEKLRGAIDGKCKITLIPERNARDLVDLALLDGPAPLWETQVLTISTVDQALELARQDRAENTKNALARFTALRARLPATVTANYLQAPEVQAELREVLRAAPNHLSASTLLQMAENQLPHELSLNRSVEEIMSASYLFVNDVFNPGEKKPRSSDDKGITVFPEREYNECSKYLARLTPILDRRSIELKSCCLAYAGALRAVWNYRPMDVSGQRTYQQWQEAARRERGFQQQTKQQMDEARSRMLLALRKLDADGSLVSEMTKK